MRAVILVQFDGNCNIKRGAELPVKLQTNNYESSLRVTIHKGRQMSQNPRLAPSIQNVRIDVDPLDTMRINCQSLYSLDGCLRIVELVGSAKPIRT